MSWPSVSTSYAPQLVRVPWRLDFKTLVSCFVASVEEFEVENRQTCSLTS